MLDAAGGDGFLALMSWTVRAGVVAGIVWAGGLAALGALGGCDSEGNVAPDAGSDAMTDGASSVDAGAESSGKAPCAPNGTGAVGVVGCACGKSGELACNGNAQKLTLVCDNHVWTTSQTCAIGQNCVTTPGPNQGICAPIDPLCASASPGQEVCSGTSVITKCGPDLVSDSPVHFCSGSTPSCVAGACSCAGTVCGNACTDTQIDPDNCGACGTVCDGGGCVSGACQSATSLEPGQAGPSAVAVDATNVYWLDPKAGNVLEAPLAGGAVTTLATGQAGPQGIALDAASVYFTNMGTLTCADGGSGCSYDHDGSVVQVPIGGGATVTLAAAQEYPVGIAVSATDVYWVDFGAGAVMVAPIGGGSAPATLAAGQAEPWDIVFHPATQSLYWVNRGTAANLHTDGTVVRLSPYPLQQPDAGVMTVMATGQAAPSALTFDATSLYWVTAGTAGASYTDGAVVRLPLVGGNPAALATAQGRPSSIAVDGKNAYYTNTLAGVIVYVPLAGGLAVPLVTGQSFPAGLPDALTVAGGKLYWADQGAAPAIQTAPAP